VERMKQAVKKTINTTVPLVRAIFAGYNKEAGL